MFTKKCAQSAVKFITLIEHQMLSLIGLNQFLPIRTRRKDKHTVRFAQWRTFELRAKWNFKDKVGSTPLKKNGKWLLAKKKRDKKNGTQLQTRRNMRMKLLFLDVF